MTDFAKLMKEIRKQTQGHPEYEIIKEELHRTAGANYSVLASDDEEDEVVQSPGKFDRFKGRWVKRQSIFSIKSCGSSENSLNTEYALRQSEFNKRFT